MDSVRGKFVLVGAILLQVGAWCTHHDLDPRKQAGRGGFTKHLSPIFTGGELLRGQPPEWLQSLESTDEDKTEEGSPPGEEVSVGDLVSTIICEEREVESTHRVSELQDRPKRQTIPWSKSSGWKHAERQNWKYGRDAAENSVIEDLHESHFDSEEDHNEVADSSSLLGETPQHSSFSKQNATLLCPSYKGSPSREIKKGIDETDNERRIWDNPKTTNLAEMGKKSKVKKRSLKIRPVGKKIERDPTKTHIYRQPRKKWSKRRRYSHKARVNPSGRKIHIKKGASPMASPALLALFPQLQS